MTTTEHTDLLVVGGGINGAGIALDAQGRGLNVRLVEQNDFASATSSASSKLIHGGLRYLEHYEFRLVREALAEREVLLRKAPHLVKPMRFILPHRPHLRPALLIRCGLFLYDNIGGKSSLLKSESVKFDSTSPLRENIQKGFEYTDCWVDDARLVIQNLVDLHRRGGLVHNYTRCVSAHYERDRWVAQLFDKRTQETFTVSAKVLVNATGPWAQSFIENNLNSVSPRKIRLVKGSHIITRRLYAGDKCYILQNEDKRIVFVIPYLNDFTIIGTTDQVYRGDPAEVSIDEQEIGYLLDVYNQHFKQLLTRKDIISDYSGVRPLCDDESNDPSAMTRDYTIDLQKVQGTAPLLNVFGGKLTTYRKLAEAALQALKSCFPDLGAPWTAQNLLPGGDIESVPAFRARLNREFPWLPHDIVQRWSLSYGSEALTLLQNAHCWEDLGEDLGGGLTEKEIEYLIEHEWALTTTDILKRRTKLGLTGPASLINNLQEWLARRNLTDQPQHISNERR